jgi:mannose-6-phosphate isomerase-like protein (cupin superfamily)
VVSGGWRTTFGRGDWFAAASFRFERGADSDIATDPRRATSIHIASGSGRLVLGTQDEVRRASPPALAACAGDLFLIPSGAHYGFVNDGAAPLVVAEHRIEPAVAFV